MDDHLEGATTNNIMKKKNNTVIANVILLALLGGTAYFGYKMITKQSSSGQPQTQPNGQPQTQPNGQPQTQPNGQPPILPNSTPQTPQTPQTGGLAGCKPCLKKPVKLYSKGCEVYQLQKYLNTNYNAKLVVDGDWGANTQSAVYANLFDKLDDNGAITLYQLSAANWLASWLTSC